MLKFAAFQRTESTMTEEGTLKALIGPKGTVQFVNKNWNDLTKRVVVLAKRADGTSAIITCSEAVSKDLRAGKMQVGHLLGLPVLTDDQERSFISLPAAVGIDIDTIEVKPYAAAGFVPGTFQSA